MLADETTATATDSTTDSSSSANDANDANSTDDANSTLRLLPDHNSSLKCDVFTRLL